MNIRLPEKRISRIHGFSLIEVLIAVVVLSIGFLALASLQAALIRASAEARAQSVAVNMAEEQIEALRSFCRRGAASTECAGQSYQTITDQAATTQSLGGVDFTRTVTVDRFVRNPANGLFEGPAADNGAPDGSTPEFKQVEVRVAWTDAAGGPQFVTLKDNISAMSPGDSAEVFQRPPGDRAGPQVRIFAPSEEGIIPIAIGVDGDGNDMASASSNPRPETFGDTGRTTTRFNVQSYVNDDVNEPLLQRRIEFALTSCSCTATGGVSTDASPSYEPTVWDGEKYSTPKRVIGKLVGRPDTAADQDDLLCTACCRDHHDSTSSVQKFDPYRPVGDYANGNHNHYLNLAAGNTTPVATGRYDEVCRFVRVGGANVVANDARLENLTQLRTQPSANGPVLTSAVKTAYANFAKAYVESAVNSWRTLAGYPATPIPDQLVNTATDPASASALADAHEALLDVSTPKDILSMLPGSTRSLNSRGIYIDYIGPDAKKAIDCIGQTTNVRCSRFASKQLLEVVPFMAINLTFLSDWPVPASSNVSVTNAAIPLDQSYDYFSTGYSYDRGTVTARSVTSSPVDVVARSYRGNSGLTDSRNVPAADPDDLSLLSTDADEIEVTGTSSGSGTIPATILLTDGSANTANFDEGGVSVRLTSPQDLSTSEGCSTLATVNATTRRYSGCNVPDTELTSITLSFTNYNRGPFCQTTGGWGLEGGGATGATKCPILSNPPSTSGQTCVKRTGSGNINNVALPTLRDYEIVVGNIPGVAVTVTEGNDVGFVGEVSTVTLTGNDNQLRTAIANGIPISFREDTTRFCPNANP